jgi:hypothetical protein
MAQLWVERRGHSRRLPSGRMVYVGRAWERRTVLDGVARTSILGRCPQCGAKILSIGMPNGGRVSFEGQDGLTRIKHPCFHRGESLGKSRDRDTADLFDNVAVAEEETD